MYRTKYYDLAITYSVVLCPVHDFRSTIYFGWIIYVLTRLGQVEGFQFLTVCLCRSCDSRTYELMLHRVEPRKDERYSSNSAIVVL